MGSILVQGCSQFRISVICLVFVGGDGDLTAMSFSAAAENWIYGRKLAAGEQFSFGGVKIAFSARRREGL
jgi:hypothetical protein